MTLVSFDVAAAKRLGAGHLLAPAAATDPLTNQGSLTIPAGVLTSGATLVAPGIAGGYAAALFDGVNDYVDTKWLTRTNEINNGNLEATLVGWVATSAFWINAGATLSLVTTPTPQFDTKAMKVVTAGAIVNEGVRIGHVVNVVAGQAKTFSVYLRGNAGGEEVRLGLGDATHGTASSATLKLTTAWQRYTVTLTPASSGESGLAIVSAPAKVQTFFVDGALLELGTVAGTFFPTVAQVTSGEASWAGSTYESQVDIGAMPRGGSRTFLMAVKMTEAKNYNGLLGFNSATATDALYISSAGTILLRVGGTDHNLGTLTAGETHRLALIVNATTGKAQVVIDGIPGEGVALTKEWSSASNLTLGVALGQDEKGYALPLAGMLRALNLSEIEQVFPSRIRVTEPIPMRQYVIATAPSGRPYRWAEDESRAENVLKDLDDEDTVPGGCKQMTGSLPRKSGVDYSDMLPGTRVEIFSSGRRKVSEYRIERAPRTAGDTLTFDPAAVGYQAMLDDRQDAQGIPLESDLSTFGEPSARLRVAFPKNHYNLNAQVQLLAAGDPLGGDTAAISHAWSQLENNGGTEPDVALSVYDSLGIELGRVIVDWLDVHNIGNEAAWQNQVIAAVDDIMTSSEALHDFNGEPGTRVEMAIAAGRFFLFLQDYYSTTVNAQNNSWEAQWRNVKIQDRAQLPLYGKWPQLGVLASDVIAYALTRWVPNLRFTTGTYGSLKATAFPIPHLTFKEAGPVSAWITAATRFEIPEWAVWPTLEGPTFFLNPRGEREGRRRWRSRVRPAELKETGPQMDRVWNGVIVQYTDPDGSSRLIGPTGSGLHVTSSRLLDTDPQNPANLAGIGPRWTKVQMKSMSNEERAIEAGEKFLELTKQLDGSGQAVLKGEVEDENGRPWPYDAVKSGDVIDFVDAAAGGDRYIVGVHRKRGERAAEITLDAPPDSMEALLEELDIVLVGLGLSSG